MPSEEQGINMAPTTTDDLQFYDLSHRWGHGMPQWPFRFETGRS
jgi:hypothetical protein